MANLQFPFNISADPGTDLWKKPPSTDDSNAPTRLHSSGPLPSLRSASISFTSTYTTQFDQAGIVLTITNPATKTTKWIKSGVEFFSGRPRLSVVCCDTWADWSVAGISGDGGGVEEAVVTGKQAVTIRVERDDTTVWIYYVDGQGAKVPLREIAWVYGDNGGEGWEVEVGALVARPNKEVKGALDAAFQALDVEWEKK